MGSEFEPVDEGENKVLKHEQIVVCTFQMYDDHNAIIMPAKVRDVTGEGGVYLLFFGNGGGIWTDDPRVLTIKTVLSEEEMLSARSSIQSAEKNPNTWPRQLAKHFAEVIREET